MGRCGRQFRESVIRSLCVEDCCFVELRCSVCSCREIRENVRGCFLIRSGAQKIVGALGLQSLSRRGGDLGVVTGGERNKNFKQIVLRQWQETARRCEASGLRSLAADDGLNDRICGCDFGGQGGN